MRILETDPDVAVDAAWFARKIGAAVSLRRDWLQARFVLQCLARRHSGRRWSVRLVVDRYHDLLVVEYFSAACSAATANDLRRVAGAQFPGCRFHAFADEHVQKQESFDFRGSEPAQPALISETWHPLRADPAGAHKTGFFADQRENRQWLSQQVAGKRVLDLCCNTVASPSRQSPRPGKVVGVDTSMRDVLDIALGNAKLNDARIKFVQADIFRGCATRPTTANITTW